MTQGDYYGGGGIAISSGALVNTFQLIPETPRPPVIGPAVVTSYEITQFAGGNGVAVCFFDSATLPANGQALFGAVPLLFAVPITAGAAFLYNVAGPGHRYLRGCSVVLASTWGPNIVYGTASMLCTMHYLPFKE